MKMKKLFLGALFVVSNLAFGVQTELGKVVVDKSNGSITSATATGSAELTLESTGNIMDITEGMMYLVLEPEANNQGDADKLNFNFDNVIVGKKVEKVAKYEARMYVGVAGVDSTNFDKLKPIKFSTADLDNKVKLSLIDHKGNEVVHSKTTNASFVMPVVNEANNVMGKLQYKISGESGLADSDYAYQGSVKATLYTHGANDDLTENGADEILIQDGATGKFVANGGKFKFAVVGMDLSQDEGLKEWALTQKTPGY